MYLYCLLVLLDFFNNMAFLARVASCNEKRSFVASYFHFIQISTDSLHQSCLSPFLSLTLLVTRRETQTKIDRASYTIRDSLFGKRCRVIGHKGDVENVHLYTIKRTSDVDINVFIQTPTQILNELKVKLFKSSSQRETLVQTITSTNSPFAYFNSLSFDNEVKPRFDEKLRKEIFQRIFSELHITSRISVINKCLSFRST